MKPFWLLVVVFVFFNSVSSQEVRHAPTVEQCRSDQSLWLSKLMDWNDLGNVNISYRELIAWGREMGECEQLDPEFRDRYRHTYTVAETGYRGCSASSTVTIYGICLMPRTRKVSLRGFVCGGFALAILTGWECELHRNPTNAHAPAGI